MLRLVGAEADQQRSEVQQVLTEYNVSLSDNLWSADHATPYSGVVVNWDVGQEGMVSSDNLTGFLHEEGCYSLYLTCEGQVFGCGSDREGSIPKANLDIRLFAGEDSGKSVLLMDQVSEIVDGGDLGSLFIRNDRSLWIVSRSIVVRGSEEGVCLAENVAFASGKVSLGKTGVWYVDPDYNLWFDDLSGVSPAKKLSSGIRTLGSLPGDGLACFVINEKGEVWKFECIKDKLWRNNVRCSFMIDEHDLGVSLSNAKVIPDGYLLLEDGSVVNLTGYSPGFSPGVIPMDGRSRFKSATPIENQGMFRFSYGHLVLDQDGVLQYYEENSGKTMCLASGVRELSGGRILKEYSGLPLYRFVNRRTNDHFVCLSAQEALVVTNTPDWEWEGF
ncbi:MAG: hypothetical protein JW706_03485, partial [Opitutales bacterium]|nr:hypothetical protein [Opitutales bacterium]